MIFTTVTSEGNLIPADLLDGIASGTAEGQKPEDFNLDKNRRVSDEIAAAWGEARSYWAAFQNTLRRLPAGDAATSVTRERWVLPLFDVLGYGSLTYMPGAAVVNGRTYAISHRAGAGEDGPPVHVEGFRRALDTRSETGRPRISPHALVQEYLNNTEHLWGIVTNGARLRLLRDSARTSRPTYVEFDLEGMMGGEKFAEFALLYRLLQRTRLPRQAEDGPTSLLEIYHQKAIESGGRVREKLREGVERALLALGRGFLEGSAKNETLVAALDEGSLSAEDYYRQLLRLVYRLLFLMVAEERKLIGGDAQGQQLYMEFYSVTRLRRQAEAPVWGQGRYFDLWLGLQATFRALEDDNGALALGVSALDGDLFGGAALPNLIGTRLTNSALLEAIHALSLYEDRESNALRRVNYSALDVEELGSVYEGLLDLRPVISGQHVGAPSAPLAFDFSGGTERKTTGSYYTRPELVHELIKSALEPVLTARLAAAASDKASQEQAILSITVCDPACGSGHFLLAAARRLGSELARIREGEQQPGPKPYRRALRDVIASCIYGVDYNRLAVDLCKLALWIESFYAGLPLSFLDSHIRWGNSLVGATRALVAAGVPDDAFTAVTGDDKPTAAGLKRRNKKTREDYEKSQGGYQRSISFGTMIEQGYDALAAAYQRIEQAPGDTVEQVHQKGRLYEEYRGAAQNRRTLYNLWTAAFFLPITPGAHVPTTETVLDYQNYPGKQLPEAHAADKLADQLGFFHWELEFPTVFKAGGFDVVLGNPPWESLQFEQEQFFATRDPQIAQAASQALREELLTHLAVVNPALALDFAKAQQMQEALNRFIRGSGRFQLTAVGKLNTYPLFTEHARYSVNNAGRVGIIVQSGIATDSSNKQFFADIINRKFLVSLYDFENRDGLFPAVHRSQKFCLLTLGFNQKPPLFCFYAHAIQHLNDPQRIFTLTPRDIELLSPGTMTCPIFRNNAEAELTKKIYRTVPTLVNERIGGASWGVSFRQGLFNMSSASSLFERHDGPERLPLYEGKMMQAYDHRAASVLFVSNNAVRQNQPEETSEEQHRDPNYRVRPLWWVPDDAVQSRLKMWPRKWLLGFKDVTASTNERSSIFSFLPRVGVGHTLPLMFLGVSDAAIYAANFIASLNSLVFDYLSRQKIGGLHLTFGILNQIPVPSPSAFSPSDTAFISERVFELVYTAWDIKPFADDVWAELDAAGRMRVRQRWGDSHGMAAPSGDETPPPFRWDDTRRALIRAELDARIARLYGLSRDDLRYILDPADVYGDDFPGETFRVLKERECRQYHEYRTQRLVLAAWDAEELVVSNGQLIVGSEQPGGGTAARPALALQPEPPAPVVAQISATSSREATNAAIPTPLVSPEASTAEPDFAVGDRVWHKNSGEGRVIAVQQGVDDQRVTVQFEHGGPKTFAARMAKLAKL